MSIIPSLAADVRGGCPTPSARRRSGVVRISGRDQVRVFGTHRACNRGRPEIKADQFGCEILRQRGLDRLGVVTRADNIRTVVHDEFVRWFGAEIAGSAEKYTSATKRIW